MAAVSNRVMPWGYKQEKRNKEQKFTTYHPTLREVILQIENKEYKSFEHRVSLLITLWTCLAENGSHLQSIREIFRLIYKESAMTILSGLWPTVSDVYKRGFARVLVQCSQEIGQVVEGSSSLCSSLVMTIYDPWGDPAIRHILNSEIIDKVIVSGYINSEPFDLLIARIECLVNANLESAALRLCRCSLKKNGLLSYSTSEINETENWKLLLMEWLLRLLFKKKMLNELVAESSVCSCHDGVSLIYRIQACHKLESEALAETLINVFLVRDLLFSSNFCCTRELMKLWCDCQVQKQQSVDEVQEAARKLLVGHASCSAHFYVLVDILWAQYGLSLLPLYLELYIRGLTSDLNYLEVARQADANESILEIENHMAAVYVKLSSMFNSVSKEVSLECLLSAFSLDPTREKLGLIKKLSMQISEEKSRKVSSNHHHRKARKMIVSRNSALPLNCFVAKKNPVVTCDRAIQVGDGNCYMYENNVCCLNNKECDNSNNLNTNSDPSVCTNFQTVFMDKDNTALSKDNCIPFEAIDKNINDESVQDTPKNNSASEITIMSVRNNDENCSCNKDIKSVSLPVAEGNFCSCTKNNLSSASCSDNCKAGVNAKCNLNELDADHCRVECDEITSIVEYLVNNCDKNEEYILKSDNVEGNKETGIEENCLHVATEPFNQNFCANELITKTEKTVDCSNSFDNVADGCMKRETVACNVNGNITNSEEEVADDQGSGTSNDIKKFCTTDNFNSLSLIPDDKLECNNDSENNHEHNILNETNCNKIHDFSTTSSEVNISKSVTGDNAHNEMCPNDGNTYDKENTDISNQIKVNTEVANSGITDNHYPDTNEICNSVELNHSSILEDAAISHQADESDNSKVKNLPNENSEKEEIVSQIAPKVCPDGIPAVVPDNNNCVYNCINKQLLHQHHSYAFRHIILDSKIPNISRELLSDFVIILESLRNQQLKSTTRWSDLRIICENYLETISSLRYLMLHSQLNGSIDSEDDSASEMTTFEKKEFASFQSDDSILVDPLVDKSNVLKRFLNCHNSKIKGFVSLSDIHYPYVPLDRLLCADVSSSHGEHQKHHRRHHNKDLKKSALRQMHHQSGHERELLKRKKKKKRKGKREKSHAKKHHSSRSKGNKDFAKSKKKKKTHRLKKKKQSKELIEGYCSDFSSAELMRLVNEHSNIFPQVPSDIPCISKRGYASGYSLPAPNTVVGETDSHSDGPFRKKRKQVSFGKLKGKKNNLIKPHEKHKESKVKLDKKTKKQCRKALANATSNQLETNSFQPNLNSAEDYSRIVQFSSVKQMQSLQIRQSSVSVDLSNVSDLSEKHVNENVPNLTEDSNVMRNPISSTFETYSPDELLKMQMLLNKQQLGTSTNDNTHRENVLYSSKNQSVLKYVCSKMTSHLLAVAEASKCVVVSNADIKSEKTAYTPAVVTKDGRSILIGNAMKPGYAHIVQNRNSSPLLNSIVVASSSNVSTDGKAVPLKSDSLQSNSSGTSHLRKLALPFPQNIQDGSGSRLVTGNFMIPFNSSASVRPLMSTCQTSGIGQALIANGNQNIMPGLLFVKDRNNSALKVQAQGSTKAGSAGKVPITMKNRTSISSAKKNLPKTVKKMVKKYIYPHATKKPVGSVVNSNNEEITYSKAVSSPASNSVVTAVSTKDSTDNTNSLQDSQSNLKSDIVYDSALAGISTVNDTDEDNDKTNKLPPEVHGTEVSSEGVKSQNTINNYKHVTSISAHSTPPLPSESVVNDVHSCEDLSNASAILSEKQDSDESSKNTEQKLAESINLLQSAISEASCTNEIDSNKGNKTNIEKLVSEFKLNKELNNKGTSSKLTKINNEQRYKSSLSAINNDTIDLSLTVKKQSDEKSANASSKKASSGSAMKGIQLQSQEKQLQAITASLIPTAKSTGLSSTQAKADGSATSETPTRSLTSISDAVRFSLMDMDDATGAVENQVLQAFHSFAQDNSAYANQLAANISDATGINLAAASNSARAVTSQASQVFQASVRSSQNQTYTDCQMTVSTATEWNVSNSATSVSPTSGTNAVASKHSDVESAKEKEEITPKKKRQKKERIERDPEDLHKFWCEICNRGFFSAYNLRRHCRNVHKMDLPKGSSDVPFTSTGTACLNQVSDLSVCESVAESTSSSTAQQTTNILPSPCDPKTPEFLLQNASPHSKKLQQASQLSSMNRSSNFPLHSPTRPSAQTQTMKSSPITPPKEFHLQSPTVSPVQSPQKFVPVSTTIPKPIPKFQMLPTACATVQTHQLPKVGSSHQIQVPVSSQIVQPGCHIQAASHHHQKVAEDQISAVVQPLQIACPTQQMLQQTAQCPHAQNKQIQRTNQSSHTQQSTQVQIPVMQPDMQQMQKIVQPFKKCGLTQYMSKIDQMQQAAIHQMQQTGVITQISQPIFNQQMQKLVQIRQAALASSPEFLSQLHAQNASEMQSSSVKSAQFMQNQMVGSQETLGGHHSGIKQSAFVGQPSQTSRAEFATRAAQQPSHDHVSCAQPAFVTQNVSDCCSVVNPTYPTIRLSSETNEGLEDLEQFLLENMPWSGEQITPQGLVHTLNRSSSSDSLSLSIPVYSSAGVLQHKNLALKNRGFVSKPKAYKPTAVLPASKNLQNNKGSSVKKKAPAKKNTKISEMGCESKKSSGTSVPVVEKLCSEKATPSLPGGQMTRCSVVPDTALLNTLHETDSYGSDSVQCIKISHNSGHTKENLNKNSVNFNAFPQQVKVPDTCKNTGFCDTLTKYFEKSSNIETNFAAYKVKDCSSVVSQTQTRATIAHEDKNLTYQKDDDKKGNETSTEFKKSLTSANEQKKKVNDDISSNRCNSLECRENQGIGIFDTSYQTENLDAEKEFNNLQSKISDCEKHLFNSLSLEKNDKESLKNAEQNNSSKSESTEQVTEDKNETGSDFNANTLAKNSKEINEAYVDEKTECNKEISCNEDKINETCNKTVSDCKTSNMSCNQPESCFLGNKNSGDIDCITALDCVKECEQNLCKSRNQNCKDTKSAAFVESAKKVKADEKYEQEENISSNAFISTDLKKSKTNNEISSNSSMLELSAVNKKSGSCKSKCKVSETDDSNQNMQYNGKSVSDVLYSSTLLKGAQIVLKKIDDIQTDNSRDCAFMEEKEETSNCSVENEVTTSRNIIVKTECNCEEGNDSHHSINVNETYLNKKESVKESSTKKSNNSEHIKKLESLTEICTSTGDTNIDSTRNTISETSQNINGDSIKCNMTIGGDDDNNQNTINDVVVSDSKTDDVHGLSVNGDDLKTAETLQENHLVEDISKTGNNRETNSEISDINSACKTVLQSDSVSEKTVGKMSNIHEDSECQNSKSGSRTRLRDTPKTSVKRSCPCCAESCSPKKCRANSMSSANTSSLVTAKNVKISVSSKLSNSNKNKVQTNFRTRSGNGSLSPVHKRVSQRLRSRTGTIT